MKRGRKQMPAAERELADRFREVVLAKRPILCGPRADGRVDPHHVCKRQRLERADRFRHLEPEELWAIAWDPDNGIPVDRWLHDNLTTAAEHLRFDELRPENVAFAERLDIFDLLARDVPSFCLDRSPYPLQEPA